MTAAPDLDLLQRVVAVARAEIPERLPDVAVGWDTSLHDELRIDSGQFIALVVALEEEFGVDLESVDVSGVRTMGDVVELIATRLAQVSGDRTRGTEP
jgi:acyl carrier protein